MKALKSLIFCLIVILGVSSFAKAAPLSVPSTILYVKRGGTSVVCTSWATACDLQAALLIANSGNQIWVAAGIYKPTTPIGRFATFQLESGVAIYGGFPAAGGALAERNWATNLTTLSGNIGNSDVNTDNSYHVVTGNNVDGTAILDGFTISGGNANESSSSQYFGGGMYNTNNSSPTLTNVTFSGNLATQGGGMYNQSSSPTLTNVTFSGNSATYYGGGMYNESSSPTLTNVTFSGNSATYYGGGMYNSSSSPTLINVTFSGNTANDSGGGMFNDSSSPMLTNVTFSGNTATWYGGGMFNISSSPELTNVTFSANSASESGGGMYNLNSSPTLINVIVWGNEPDQIYNSSSSSTPAITYSDIQGGGYPDTSNIITDPLLGPLADNGGFTQTHALGYGSPAIDAGTAVCTATDQRGYPRPIDGDGNGSKICDMGAYEYYHTVYLPILLK